MYQIELRRNNDNVKYFSTEKLFYTFSDLQTDGNDDKTYDYVIKDIVGNKKTCKIKVTRYKQYRYHKKSHGLRNRNI